MRGVREHAERPPGRPRPLPLQERCRVDATAAAGRGGRAMSAPARLFVADDIAAGRPVALSAGQAHYLRHVLRLAPGAPVTLFNGRDGEWRGRVAALGKTGGTAIAGALGR